MSVTRSTEATDNETPVVTVPAKLDAAARRIAELTADCNLAEAMARRVADEAELHRGRYRAMLDGISLAVILLDADAACLYFNDAARRAMQVREDDDHVPLRHLATRQLFASGLEDRLALVLRTGRRQQWHFADQARPVVRWCVWLAKVSASSFGQAALLSFAVIDMTDPNQQRAGRLARAALQKLSSREREVLEWVTAGVSTQQIAEKIHRSVKTVQLHRYHIASKLGTTNIACWTQLLLAAGELRTKLFRDTYLP